ncbi:polypyrimidine tract-binding protein homolog 2 isoform X1 [Tanacetum coccineum]
MLTIQLRNTRSILGNIKGVELFPKQGEFGMAFLQNNLSFLLILEYLCWIRINEGCPLCFYYWNWTSNGNCCSKDTRIILGWNHNDVDIVVLNQDDQAIHVRLWLKLECKELFCTFVYAHNRDFNAALFFHDSSAGNSNIDISMREFKECVEDLEVMDVQHSGLQFTWSQKPKGKEGLLKKIDRVMANLIFNEKFAGSNSFGYGPFQCSYFVGNRSLVLDALEPEFMKGEKFLKQKAKIDWLREGDSNSAYFHKSVKSRSRIDVVATSDGVVYENDKVAEAFVSHYEIFLGQPGSTTGFCDNDLFQNSLEENVALEMTRMVTRQEVKSALFSMGNEKSPGPDGKIIANRIKESLKVLVSPNQSAFVPSRSIVDNILLTQELMHNYHLDRGPPRCAFKVDIQKAYDTVDWGFLKNILAGFDFHTRMIGWIMECVTTTSFSVCINGSLHGFFKGKRGLRQSDPLSPYLFTLVMEILTLMLQRGVRNANSFTYHRYCSRMELINLCFAYDLFLFAHGDTDSVRVIKEALVEFKEASGLVPSLPKSKAYFCNVIDFNKLAILQILTFEEGCLPVKYLGVPLVTSRLVFRYCKELIEKVQARVDDWKNKFLSVAGRLQLIRSVLSSMHIYWASMFIMCKI